MKMIFGALLIIYVPSDDMPLNISIKNNSFSYFKLKNEYFTWNQ